MTFFNRKEEVIDIQLTQYGKHLLSKGKFKPIFYAFYDDDILYNSSYGGFEEEQKGTEKRIKETPRIKMQHNYSNRDLNSKTINNNFTKTTQFVCQQFIILIGNITSDSKLVYFLYILQ